MFGFLLWSSAATKNIEFQDVGEQSMFLCPCWTVPCTCLVWQANWWVSPKTNPETSCLRCKWTMNDHLNLLLQLQPDWAWQQKSSWMQHFGSTFITCHLNYCDINDYNLLCDDCFFFLIFKQTCFFSILCKHFRRLNLTTSGTQHRNSYVQCQSHVQCMPDHQHKPPSSDVANK